MLDGKIAIVTGGRQRHRQGDRRSLRRCGGARVTLAGRRRDRLDAAAADIGERAEAAVCDVTDHDRVEALFDGVVSRHGQVDILVNNAGMSAPTPTHELDPAVWRQVIDVNLTGAFLCARAALRRMIPRKSGRIINIGSISAQMSRPNAAPYTASKFGLEGVDSLARPRRAGTRHSRRRHPPRKRRHRHLARARGDCTTRRAYTPRRHR